MEGNYCAFNYATMPSREVCAILPRPVTTGVPPPPPPPLPPPRLTDEHSNLLMLISANGVEVVSMYVRVCGGGGGGLSDEPNASTRSSLTVANKIKEPVCARAAEEDEGGNQR